MNPAAAKPRQVVQPAAVPPVQIVEGRFSRLEAIEWWDQALLSRTKVLVVGAGALGNEVIKNLALLGVGHVAIADMDRVELSNLSRSVLFRETDEGKFKAECAARAARQIFDGMQTTALVGNILADLGLGWFRWAGCVIGALDNREARVFVNSACARVGRPWIDGGIEVLHGVARGFAPPKTACYECTMSKVDWDLLNKRRSCSLLARRALAQRGTPTTPTTASVIGAIQVQEMVKLLHGRSALLGRGFIFDGAEHSSYTTTYQVDPDCPWHESPASIETMPQFNSETKLANIWQEAARQLGGVDALDFAREIVERLECPACGGREEVFQPAEKIGEDRLHCRACGAESAAVFLHSVGAKSNCLEKTAREIGLPAWDIIWARHGEQTIGFELSSDNPFAGDGSNIRK
jgi:molybdopterin/thiamine biosynthesis adenylyltransferase